MKITTFKHAENLIKTKRFTKALNYINNNRLNISNKDYFYLSAVCYRYLDDSKKALTSLDQLIQIAPEYGRAYQEFGHVYFKDENKTMSSNRPLHPHRRHLQWAGSGQSPRWTPSPAWSPD